MGCGVQPAPTAPPSTNPIVDTLYEHQALEISRSFVRPSLPPKPKLKPKVRPKPKPRPVVVHHVVHHNPPASVRIPTSRVKRYAYDRLGPTQYACLASIVSKEDYDWSPTKSNYGGSGAYGIPQALPGSKMASAGADWRTNGITQVKWMIGYVNSRYGSACGAWSYWQAHHSY